MEIRQLQQGDEKRLERFLRPRTDSSMFLRATLHRAGLVNRGERYAGDYVGAFRGKSLVGVVAHFNQGNLAPQAPLAVLPELVPAMLQASGRDVEGAGGPADQVGAVLETLGKVARRRKLDELEGLYTLDLAVLRVPSMLRAQRIAVRPIEESDRQLLVPWFDAYGVETLGDSPGAERTRRSQARFDTMLAEERGFLLLRDGERVAFSGFNAVLPDAVQVGGVYTPPCERRKGFARGVVAGSLLAARKRGAQRAILFTDDDNVAAIRAYRALGFEREGDFRLTLLG